MPVEKGLFSNALTVCVEIEREKKKEKGNLLSPLLLASLMALFESCSFGPASHQEASARGEIKTQLSVLLARAPFLFLF